MLRLTDDGRLDFEGWGELTEDFVWKTLYPKLHEAWTTVWDEQEKSNNRTLTAEQQERILRAAQEERERVPHKNVTAPQTAVGKDIKRMSDMPTSLVDKIVNEVATEQLKHLKPRGKRH